MKNNDQEPMQLFVKNQTNTLRDIWFTCSDEFFPQQIVISAEKKQHNEDVLSALLGWLSDQLEISHRTDEVRKDFSSEAIFRLKGAVKEIFGFSDLQINCLESLGIVRTAESFFHQAREFDPFISFTEVYQAGRNVWTSNYLQVLLGLKAELTPSLFAYSMLYPVSDNYLDNPNVSRAEKAAYNYRFWNWLKGVSEKPGNANEQDVLDLVRMIEKQYPREQYDQVYESLLAIFIAQDKSMRIPKLPLTPGMVDIVGLTFEKGGTSVLADGVLAAGELDFEKMETIFNYGAFAQLMDDQEDMEEDLHDRNPTLFTEAAQFGKVDQVMNRVFCFAHQMLEGLNKFENPEALPLKQMSMQGIDFLLIDAVLRTEKHYSKAYLHKLEAYFPFRFEYLNGVRKMIKKKGITADRLMGLMIPKMEPVGLYLVDPLKMLFTERRLISSL